MDIVKGVILGVGLLAGLIGTAYGIYNTSTETASDGIQKKKLCAVCNGTFSGGEVVSPFPCRHVIHKNCFSLLKDQKRCPYCTRY